MVRLLTFGGLRLEGGARYRLASQRRRLALLTLLAASDSRGLTRDQLIAYLWPEATADGSRHALEQLLYALRQTFSEALFEGVNPLRLNMEVLGSDVAEFCRALEHGAHADAVALYRGPFLDGFYLSGAPEFERWTEQQREDLRQRYAAALSRLADEAQSRGDFTSRIDHLRRLAAVDRCSSRVAMQLMRALAESGDRAAALSYVKVYESILRAELDSTLDVEVAAYANRLRSIDEPAARAHTTAGPGTSSRRADTLVNPPSVALTDSPESPPRRPRRWHWAAPVAGALLMIVTVMIEAGRSHAPRRKPQLLGALPVRALDDPGLKPAASVVGSLLVEALASPRLTADGVDEARAEAQRLGVSSLLMSDLVALKHGGLALTGRLVSREDGTEMALPRVIGSLDGLPSLADRFASVVLATQGGLAEPGTVPRFNVSPAVLRLYLQGHAKYRRGDDIAALHDFGAALNADSTFAPAALGFALATGWLVRFSTGLEADAPATAPVAYPDIQLPVSVADWKRAVAIAWRGRDQLLPSDRSLLEAIRGTRSLDEPLQGREAVLNWERAAEFGSSRPDAQSNFGTLLLHQGLAIGQTDSRARAAAAFAKALAIDSLFMPARLGLIETAALDNDTTRLSTQARIYLAIDSAGPFADYVRWRVAAARHHESDLNRLRARVATMPIQSLVCMQWASQMSGVELDDADRATTEILRRSPGRWERRRMLYDANVLAQNRGRPHESARLWSETPQLLHGSRPDVVWERLIDFGVFGGGDTSAARIAAAEAAAAAAEDLRAPISSAASRSTIARRLYNIFIWKLAHDDTAGIRRMIGRVRRDYDPVEAAMLDADLAVVAGDSNAREKLLVLDSLALFGCCEAWPGAMLAARLHERLGDREGALRMVRAAQWQFAPADLATALHEEGRLAEATGGYDAARRAYAHYLALRSRPEPEVEREVSAVRAELARITKH
ncbi:MAG: hypothetical protein NVS4B3_20740 [Gemmatimonadaceae bacterium]